MIKLKMHAMYDHFPEHNPQDGEPYLDCYSDSHIYECTERGNNIALMLEPRSMLSDKYEYVRSHADYFKAIFTHDSELLRLPQAHYLNWADVWLTTDSEKNKGISICTSFKNWCPLHVARLEFAKMYKDSSKVDAYFGDWNNPEIPNVKPQDYLEHYKFSIVIENDIDDYWFTEKILNCFSTKTVPIYVGAKKIYNLFNSDGIIQIDDWKDIPRIIDHLNIDEAYQNRLEAINDNFRRVEPYKVNWKERFFRDYEALMEGLLQ
jgi:hypothetical protein